MKKTISLLLLTVSIALLSCNGQQSATEATVKTNNPSQTAQPVYQLFPTTNMWTFLKLNTRNGKIRQIQYTINEDGRGGVDVNTTPLVSKEKEHNGRFTLYPTQNMWNFILLDQTDGRTWQVQWSMKAENRDIIPIESDAETNKL